MLSIKRWWFRQIAEEEWARSIQSKFQTGPTGKRGPPQKVFSKLFRLDRTDALSFGPKFPEILVKWIAPSLCSSSFW